MADDATPNYEFTEQENKIFTDLTRNMRVLAYSMFLGGALYVIYGCFLTIQLSAITTGLPILAPAIISVLAAFLAMFLGLFLNKSAADFVQIVCTQGSDISHLMRGISDLKRFFIFSAYLAWPLVLVLLGAVLLVTFWGTAAFY
ncbi:MAG: hypothetical protein AB1758_10625 [Candidatus Eremiobacterota bacterium]